jgi:hypothetical protein
MQKFVLKLALRDFPIILDQAVREVFNYFDSLEEENWSLRKRLAQKSQVEVISPSPKEEAPPPEDSDQQQPRMVKRGAFLMNKEGVKLAPQDFSHRKAVVEPEKTIPMRVEGTPAPAVVKDAHEAEVEVKAAVQDEVIRENKPSQGQSCLTLV